MTLVPVCQKLITVCPFMQKISQLEEQICKLREEVVQGNQHRKQQLVELGLLREEEKQKMSRDHENQVNTDFK